MRRSIPPALIRVIEIKCRNVINIEQWSKLLRQRFRPVPALIVVECRDSRIRRHSPGLRGSSTAPGTPSFPQGSRLQLLERHNTMQDVDVRVDQAFWASSILPEGIVQRWFIADGSIAETGDKMADN